MLGRMLGRMLSAGSAENLNERDMRKEAEEMLTGTLKSECFEKPMFFLGLSMQMNMQMSVVRNINPFNWLWRCNTRSGAEEEKPWWNQANGGISIIQKDKNHFSSILKHLFPRFSFISWIQIRFHRLHFFYFYSASQHPENLEHSRRILTQRCIGISQESSVAPKNPKLESISEFPTPFAVRTISPRETQTQRQFKYQQVELKLNWGLRQ